MEPPYNERLIGIGDPHERGFFCSLAPLYIYKKNALAYWSNYQAKFGIPPVIAKTDLSNDQRVKDLSRFMQEMRSNSWLICDQEDEIQPMGTASVDGYLTYRNMIEVLTAGISKVIDGQTMTSDNGGSRAQGEVHERTSESWQVARLRNAERVINEKVIPLMIRDGFKLTEGDSFWFRKVEDDGAIIDKVQKLSLSGFTVDPQWIIDKIVIPVTAAPVPSPAIKQMNAALGLDFFR
jgi:phage gp29-like protein